MSNLERIKANNAELQECIDKANALPNAGSGGGELTPVATSLIRRGLGYIDTGIDGANNDLTIEVQYELETVPTGYWYLLRAYVNESTNATRILYNKNAATYCCLNSIPSSSLSITQTRYANVVYTDTLKAESSTSFSYTTNGVKTTKARSNGEELVGKNLLLFSDSTTDDGVVAKVYYLKIYDGTLLVRDYVPYIRSDGECGLYDNVTKRFFGNSGSGTFEADTISAGGGGSIDTSGLTATADKVLLGETFIGANGEMEEGTIPQVEDSTIVLNTSKVRYQIPKGYHSGNGTVGVDYDQLLVTPTKQTQIFGSVENKDSFIGMVTVAPIPDEYIIPSGAKEITENGTHDVTAYASVNVNVNAGITEIWLLTMEDGTEVTKEVVVV